MIEVWTRGVFASLVVVASTACIDASRESSVRPAVTYRIVSPTMERDNSLDSRYWGFVYPGHLVGVVRPLRTREK